jgi:hypothetical protein
MRLIDGQKKEKKKFCKKSFAQVSSNEVFFTSLVGRKSKNKIFLFALIFFSFSVANSCKVNKVFC